MTKRVPVLTYKGSTSAKLGAAITLKALLKYGSTALSGRTVTFILDGVSTQRDDERVRSRHPGDDRAGDRRDVPDRDRVRR